MPHSGSEGPLGQRLLSPSMRIALIVAFAQFMQNLDATIIVTALPDMAHSFGTSASRMSAGITAYVLTAATCIPASGWLADRVGARNLFCAAIDLFTISSMACGAATTFPMFIAARVVQGSSSGMMAPVGRLLVLRHTEQRDLMRTLSTLVWPALLAPVMGPPLGGFITGAASWRWIFYVNLPLGIAAMALVLSFIPRQTPAQRTDFDGKGFALTALAVICLTCGFDVIGSHEIDIPLATGLLATAAVAGFLAVRHLQTTAAPLLRLQALRERTFFVACVSGGSITSAAISATPFLLPLMLQVGFGLPPVQSGLMLLIYMAANLGMKAFTNPILRKLGIRRVLVVNGLICPAAIACCALVSPALALPVSGLILVAAGASRSMQFTAITFVTFADIPPEERASANSLSALMGQVSTGIGVAVAALLLNFSRLSRHATSLSLYDFHVALVACGLLGTLAVFSYAGLAHDAGAGITGHKRAAGH